MIKSTINQRTDVVTTYKNIRKMSACVEKMGIFLGGWVVVCSLGGESWDVEEEEEIEEERVGRVWVYWLLLMESPTDMSCRYIRR
jgi:3'-phosphoadenosine 5'-phosphosulfate sulfotransferase